MPLIAFGMQDRKPGLVFRVETPRRDCRECPGSSLVAIFTIHIKKYGNGWAALYRLISAGTDPPEHLLERGADHLRPARPDTLERLEPAIMCCKLKPLERIYMKLIMNMLRQPWTDTRNSLQALHRIQRTAHALELRPAPGCQNFIDGCRNTAPDIR